MSLPARSRREQGRRHLPFASNAMTSPAIHGNLRRPLAGETVDYVGKHLRVEGGKLLYDPVQHRIRLSTSAFLRRGNRCRGTLIDKLSHFGASPPNSAGEDRGGAEGGPCQGPQAQLRHQVHVIRARNRGGGLARRDRLIEHLDDADDCLRPERVLAHGFGGPKPHGVIARRAPRQARKSAPICGRGRPSARRRRHGLSRSGHRGPAHARIHGPWHRQLSFSRATRISRSLSLREARDATLPLNHGQARPLVPSTWVPSARPSPMSAAGERPRRPI